MTWIERSWPLMGFDRMVGPLDRDLAVCLGGEILMDVRRF